MTILVQQLKAEIDQLRSQLEMAKKHGEVLQQIGNALRLGAGSDLHTACVPEIVALRRDAERYRYLRDGACTVATSRRELIVIEDMDAIPGDFANGGEMLSAAIDQAMTKEQP